MDATRVFQPIHLLVALLLLTAALYGQVVDHGFINWDDGRYVAENRMVHAGLSWGGLVYAFTATDPFLMPLVRLSFMAESSWLGMAAGHFHVVNVLFHLANICLLYGVVVEMTGARWKGVMVAAVLALHPRHVEAVVWVTERKEVMSAFFAWISLWHYGRHARLHREFRPGGNALAWSLLSFMASLLCKPMWVTLPFLLLLLDYWPLGRWPVGWWPLLREKAWFFLLSLIFSLVTLASFALDEAITPVGALPWEHRLTKMVAGYAGYWVKAVWPVELALYYPHPRGTVSWWSLLGYGLLLLAASGMAWRQRRSQPWWLVGWCWFLGLLFPVSGLVEGGMPVAMADRWSYTPHVGLFMAMIWSGDAMTPLRRNKIALIGLALVVAGWWSLLTRQQIATWQDSETVWQQVIRVNPEDGYAHWKLGRFYHLTERYPEAAQQFREAARHRPDHVDYQLNLWQALERAGLVREAAQQLETLRRILSGRIPALVSSGEVLLRDGYFSQAAQFFQDAMAAVGPQGNTSYIRFQLALALFADGQPRQGEAHLGQLFSGDPEKVAVRCQRAEEYLTNGKGQRQEFRGITAAVARHCRRP